MRTVSAGWVVPVEGEPIRDGAVVIADDGTVAAIGPAVELGAGEAFPGAVIVPGLVNAHTHLEYAVYAGFGDGLPFVPWIGLHIRRKAALDPEDVRAIATLGAWECLRSGVTTVGDCSFAGATAEAAAATGLGAVVFVEVFGADATALDRFAEIRERIGPALGGTVRLGVSPHAPYTCSPDLYRACAELGLPLQTHLAESPAERDWLLAGQGDWEPLRALLVSPPGETGVRLLAAEGLLGPQLSAAHCVHVDEEEIELLATSGTGVAHCPRSNGYLGCGTAPVAELRTAGAVVSVATDSPASTPSLDLFEELRCAVVAARSRAQRPDAFSAEAALRSVTLDAARVLGLDTELGSLVPGKRADLAVIDLTDGPFDPLEDPVTAVVLGGSPDRVAATLLAGDVRYRRGITTWPDSTRASRRARARMLP